MLNITVIVAQAEANTQVIEDFSERLSLFGEVTLLGMGTVFIVLAILWGLIALIGFFFDLHNKKVAAKNSAAKEKEASAAAKVPATPVAEQTPAQQDNNGALVAAITAAIAAYIDADETLQEEYSGGFRVVSFRRAVK